MAAGDKYNSEKTRFSDKVEEVSEAAAPTSSAWTGFTQQQTTTLGNKITEIVKAALESLGLKDDDNDILEGCEDTFASGDYIGLNSMVWTVGSGDVIELSYHYQHKNRMIIDFTIANASISGSPLENLLRIKIPDGRTALKAVSQYCGIIENGTKHEGTVKTQAGTNYLRIQKASLANFVACTNTMECFGYISVPLEPL